MRNDLLALFVVALVEEPAELGANKDAEVVTFPLFKFEASLARDPS